MDVLEDRQVPPVAATITNNGDGDNNGGDDDDGDDDGGGDGANENDIATIKTEKQNKKMRNEKDQKLS